MKIKYKAIVLIDAENEDDAIDVLLTGDANNFSIQEIKEINNE